MSIFGKRGKQGDLNFFEVKQEEMRRETERLTGALNPVVTATEIATIKMEEMAKAMEEMSKARLAAVPTPAVAKMIGAMGATPPSMRPREPGLWFEAENVRGELMRWEFTIDPRRDSLICERTGLTPFSTTRRTLSNWISLEQITRSPSALNWWFQELEMAPHEIGFAIGEIDRLTKAEGYLGLLDGVNHEAREKKPFVKHDVKDNFTEVTARLSTIEMEMEIILGALVSEHMTPEKAYDAMAHAYQAARRMQSAVTGLRNRVTGVSETPEV